MGIPKGTKLWDPEGNGGYEITEDIASYSPVMARQFKAFGGQPDLVAGEPVEGFLKVILKPGGWLKLTARPAVTSPTVVHKTENTHDQENQG